jgi:hypothetical protein
MKNYVYTFWTKPLIKNNSLYKNIVFLLLSIHLTKKLASNITIYTDTFGENILKKFNLNININTKIINQFDNLSLEKWSIPKLYTINDQQNPHCHIDHDVFLWSEMPEFQNECDIVTQNIEVELFFTKYYKESFYRFFENNESIPIDLLSCLETNDFGGYNCGYLDIYNIDVSKEWTDFAINMHNCFVQNFTWSDCTLVEQFSLYFLSKKNNYKIDSITKVDFLSDDGGDFLYKPNFDFKYTHLMKEKENPEIIHKVEKIIQKLDINLYNQIYDNQSFLLNND